MMEKYKHNHSPKEKRSIMQPAILTHLIENESFISDSMQRPKRCRAIIFNPEGTKILGIKRVRPDREPYIVYPGGGLETSDASAKDGIWRELNEELGLTPDQVTLTDNLIALNDEFFYLGYAPVELSNLTIGGPEAQSDPSSGHYLPGWFDISQLILLDAFPTEISQIIVGATDKR